MKTSFLGKGKAWLLVFLFLVIGITDAGAGIFEPEPLTISGFLRQTAVYNMGTANPRNVEKADFNLIRSMFQIEVNYEPTDIFRFFLKARVNYDQTYMLQGEVDKYNTTPWTFEHHGSDLRTGYGENTFMAEIWEAWANLELDNLWIRLGKQQIAWGDMVAVRIADQINPLDRSWHLISEPEEFENIRIPEWSARVYYSLPETITGPFDAFYVEAFLNPGDIHNDIQPATGSPYENAFSSLAGDANFDLRGETEWGARLGFDIAGFQTSFNYLSVHMDYPVWDVNVPSSLPNHTHYPEIEVYAVTLNYAFNNPINTAVQCEASYTPDYMWQSTYIERGLAPGGPPKMEEGAWWKFGIIMERDFNVIPRRKLMNVKAMWYRHWVDSSDADKVKLSPAPLSDANRLDWAWDLFMISFTQMFGPDGNYNHEAKFDIFWCPEGSYQFKLFYNWKPTGHWRFDIGAQWRGGAGDQAFLHNNSGWNDELYSRLTYFF